MCKHDKVVQKYQKVSPPVRCYPFTMRFSECVSCGYTFATAKQRKKNRENFNRAYRRYNQDNNTHGIYY
jgi:uncharacterized Fe-S cluster-containing MiaB family protein